MSVPQVDASQFHINVLWSGSIGYLLATVISILLFIQLLYSFTQEFKPNDLNEPVSKSKTPYILVMIYLVNSIITSIIFLTVQTNTFAIFSCEFNRSRCLSAFIVWPSLILINYTILSLIFLHRIYVTFKDSTFEYSPKIYRTFLFLITIPSPTLLAALYIPIIGDLYVFSYRTSSDFAFCASSSNKQQFDLGYVALSIVITLLQFINIVGLLSLFIKGLWSLNQQMILHYVENTHKSSTQLSFKNVPSNSNQNPKHSAVPSTTLNTAPPTPTPVYTAGDSEEVERVHTQSTLSVGDVLDSWSKQRTIQREQTRLDVERIVKLHNLMKKQTILVCIAIISTITTFVFVGYNVNLLMDSGWDMIVNAICVWMMLDTSKLYWNGCKNYGFCVCCYWKTNKMGM